MACEFSGALRSQTVSISLLARKYWISRARLLSVNKLDGNVKKHPFFNLNFSVKGFGYSSLLPSLQSLCLWNLCLSKLKHEENLVNFKDFKLKRIKNKERHLMAMLLWHS